jgi:hypothetical protein
VFFTWDFKKAEVNVRKHGVDFHEAATVLEDPLSTTFSDSEHSTTEHRFITVGMSAGALLLVVVHTEREDKIRIISARRATRHEQRFYEED